MRFIPEPGTDRLRSKIVRLESNEKIEHLISGMPFTDVFRKSRVFRHVIYRKYPGHKNPSRSCQRHDRAGMYSIQPLLPAETERS